MYRFFKKSIRGIAVIILGGLFLFPTVLHASDFLVDFAGPLLSEGGWGDEKAFTVDGLQYVETDGSVTFLDNLKALFYPDFEGGGGALWNIIKNITIGLLIAMFIWAGAYLMFFADKPEDVKQGLLNLLYLIIGAVILFFAIRLIGKGLDFSGFSGLTGGDDSIVNKLEHNVLLMVIGIIKGIAFFAAIIFIIYYGYKMITAFDQEEKLKIARSGVLNVIIALLFIKLIDYMYFIVLQGSFKDKAIDLVVGVSKVLGYVVGLVIVIMMIYAGYLMVTANGDDEQVSKAKNLVRTIFIAILVLMLFLLIIYQIFNDVVT